jgi:hypothetical protein
LPFSGSADADGIAVGMSAKPRKIASIPRRKRALGPPANHRRKQALDAPVRGVPWPKICEENASKRS